MHYFSIHNPQGEHLGFLVMVPDNEHNQITESGQFALKIQSEYPPNDIAALAVLSRYEQSEAPLCWVTDKYQILLSCDDKAIGTIRQENLILDGHNLLLTDLTGAV